MSSTANNMHPNAKKALEKYRFKRGSATTDPRRYNTTRPRIQVKHIIKELKKDGYDPMSKRQLVDMILIMLNLDKNVIREIVTRDEVPIVFEIIARALATRNGFDVINTLLDRALGKARATLEVEAKENPPKQLVILQGVIEEAQVIEEAEQGEE